MKSLGMIVDLAHASSPLIDDIVNLEQNERKSLQYMKNHQTILKLVLK